MLILVQLRSELLYHCLFGTEHPSKFISDKFNTDKEYGISEQSSIIIKFCLKSKT